MRLERFYWAALLVVGCSGQAIEVGGGPSSGGAGTTIGETGGNGVASSAGNAGASNTTAAGLACTDDAQLPAWPSADDCTANSDLPIVGTWNGYIENQGEPWAALSLVIRGASVAGGVCGTLTIGSGTPPAPATDPDHGYLPGGATGALPRYPYLVPGYTFTLLEGTTDGTRVRFGVNYSEPWRGWCQLQTSYAAASGPENHDCGCLPNWDSETNGDGNCHLIDPAHVADMIVDCNKRNICMDTDQTCTCFAEGCDGKLDGHSVTFDLRFATDEAEGSSNATPTNTRTLFSRAQ